MPLPDVPGAIYRHMASRFPAPVAGSLHVWWIPQIPGRQFLWPVKDLDQATLVLDVLAGYDDFQYGEKVKGDYCNTGGLLIFEDGEWVDWESAECDDFETWREHQLNKEIDHAAS